MLSYLSSVKIYIHSLRMTFPKISENMANDKKEKPGSFIDRYKDIKQKNMDRILLFRCGNCYETYSKDAETVAKELGLSISYVKDIYGHCMKTASFPYSSLDSYLPKLCRKYKITICDSFTTECESKESD